MIELLNETKAFLTGQGIEHVDIGVTLGTGLGDLVNHVKIIKTIDYAKIPHFPISTVEFHKGQLLYAELNTTRLLIMQGRFHLYEGYSMQQITYPIRLMKMMGAQALLLSNAAGGINKDFKKGDLVVIEDHINLQGNSPLVGPNHDSLGPRFPDMSCPYSPGLNKLLHQTALELGVSIKTGVYASVTGPNLETRAEYRYLGRIGADMVGMSTVPEVIVANHMNLPCAAVSVITDECDPENLKPVNIAEIIEVAGKSDKALSQIFIRTIGSMTFNEHNLFLNQ